MFDSLPQLFDISFQLLNVIIVLLSELVILSLLFLELLIQLHNYALHLVQVELIEVCHKFNELIDIVVLVFHETTDIIFELVLIQVEVHYI